MTSYGARMCPCKIRLRWVSVKFILQTFLIKKHTRKDMERTWKSGVKKNRRESTVVASHGWNESNVLFTTTIVFEFN